MVRFGGSPGTRSQLLRFPLSRISDFGLLALPMCGIDAERAESIATVAAALLFRRGSIIHSLTVANADSPEKRR